jgi:hypothetical protein
MLGGLFLTVLTAACESTDQPQAVTYRHTESVEAIPLDPQPAAPPARVPDEAVIQETPVEESPVEDRQTGIPAAPGTQHESTIIVETEEFDDDGIDADDDDMDVDDDDG